MPIVIHCNPPTFLGPYLQDSAISYPTVLAVLFNIVLITMLINYFYYIKVTICNILAYIYTKLGDLVEFSLKLPLNILIFVFINFLLLLINTIVMATYACISSLDFSQFFVDLNNICLGLDHHLAGEDTGVYLSINEGTGVVSNLGTDTGTGTNTNFTDYLERKAHYYLRIENGVNADGRVHWHKIHLSELKFNFDSKQQLFYEDTPGNGRVCSQLSELYHTKRSLFNQVLPDKTDVWGIIDHLRENRKI